MTRVLARPSRRSHGRLILRPVLPRPDIRLAAGLEVLGFHASKDGNPADARWLCVRAKKNEKPENKSKNKMDYYRQEKREPSRSSSSHGQGKKQSEKGGEVDVVVGWTE